MVNGHYILYGDKPSSESEIVDDHVQTRTAERKNKRKSSRNANELQRTLNMAQLDNETDSVKYEKKIKEPPRLLRYVPTTDVKENFVTENFETYDLKPTEERPRRYAFRKKAKNPSDGSVNYAYSRSSSSCSSPNGNLPTISENVEQYGTYRAQPLPSPRDEEMIKRYEHKLDKYFCKQNEGKSFAAKVNYEGSHPDSLYRVQASSGTSVDRLVRALRLLRWPAALVAVCIALAVFVYFLMPDNIDGDGDGNRTYWEPVAVGAHSSFSNHKPPGYVHNTHKKPGTARGTKTPEIDFYNSETNKNTEFTSIIDTITESTPHTRIPPIKPVFPSHITPEVQYGNEKADANNLRTPKLLDVSSTPSVDSTLKPHITQKPEKPLAVYFEDLNEDTTTHAETFTRAETGNEFANYGDKQTTKNVEISTKSHPVLYKDGNYRAPIHKVKPLNIKQYLVTETEIPPEIQEYNGASAPENINVNFTSGHSKLFGISIEDAGKMRSTTQSSLYNTRVSPTLPTWRDGDDTTTKHYPVNINYEVVQCRSTRIPLCSGILPYDLAGLPAVIADVDVSTLLPQIQYLAATNCSERVRQFACALLEPECNPPRFPPKRPCYNLCKSILDSCDGMIPSQLSPIFECKQYSHNNCVDSDGPCYDRELTCDDGSCIPRGWICDGTKDCPSGEDEVACTVCEKDEFRCKSGSCILKRWVCDGYTDCPYGEDETESCDWQAGEIGEESAGSAPAPVVRRPNRLPTGEIDSSKELLVTSDSSNAFKRNFTRRPSLSRLTPYTRTTQATTNMKPDEKGFDIITKTDLTKQEPTQKPAANPDRDSGEDFGIGGLGFFDELKKTMATKNNEPVRSKPNKGNGAVPIAVTLNARSDPSGLDKSVAKLEKVINGAELLKRSQAMEQEAMDSPESNSTTTENIDVAPPVSRVSRRRQGSVSAHASPCPSGELRCVDGRCITLAQLCDGTVDCSDSADEDNCYT